MGRPDGRPSSHNKLMELSEIEALMHAFVKEKGWYDEDTSKEQSVRNLAISLVLEASEVLEHFQWREEITQKDELAAELADVALYLIQLASISGIELEQAILRKLQENRKREWPAP